MNENEDLIGLCEGLGDALVANTVRILEGRDSVFRMACGFREVLGLRTDRRAYTSGHAYAPNVRANEAVGTTRRDGNYPAERGIESAVGRLRGMLMLMQGWADYLNQPRDSAGGTLGGTKAYLAKKLDIKQLIRSKSGGRGRSRTHRTLFKRPNGFEGRAPHRRRCSSDGKSKGFALWLGCGVSSLGRFVSLLTRLHGIREVAQRIAQTSVGQRDAGPLGVPRTARNGLRHSRAPRTHPQPIRRAPDGATES